MFGLPPILAHLVELAALALVSAISARVGLLVLRVLGVASALSLGERLVFGLVLGYGTLGFLMLGMGLLGIIYAPLGVGLLVVLAAVGYGPAVARWAIARRLKSRATVAKSAYADYVRRDFLGGLRYPPHVFLAGVVLVCAGAALAKALAPVATQDDLMYHLALPRRYIEAHAIDFYPDSTYSLFPQLMEMLYTWGLLLGSDRLSVLFAFSMGLLGPAAAALFARRYLGGDKEGLWRALPLLTAALFLSTPLVGFVLRAANTDLAQASFDLLAVYAFYLGVKSVRATNQANPVILSEAKNPVEHRDVSTRHSHATPTGTRRARFFASLRMTRGRLGLGRERRTGASGFVTGETLAGRSAGLFALSGLMCGLSFSTKYYGFAMAVALGMALLFLALFRWRARGYVALLAFSIAFIAPVAVWLLRNVVEAGNPVWPLAGGLFGGNYWSPETEASPETLLGKGPPLGLASLWTAVEFIWYSMTRPPLAIDRQVHAVNLGPLLLPALLALPFARWRSALGWVAYAAGAYWLIWALFFSRTSIRYLSTFFLLAAILSAYALVSLATRHKLAQWALGGMVAIVLAVLVLEAGLSARPYLPTVLAAERAAQEEYLQAYMEDYPMMEYIEANTPQDAVIYVWDGQPRGYRIPRRYVYARLVPLYTGFGSEPESWRTRLRELGVTYVLVHRRDILAPGQPIGLDPQLEAGREFAERYFSEPLFQIGNYALYQLR